VSTAITKLAGRLGRDTAIFAAATFATVILAFVNAGVVTRHLSPAEFGRLAVYYFFAALLTVAYGLMTLQGTLLWIFGSAGEEDLDDEEGVRRVPRGSKRRALTTGLLMAIVVGGTGTAAAALFSRPLNHLLLGDSAGHAAVVIAAASGGMGGLWRLVSSVFRFAGRPWAYAILINARPVLVIACIIFAVSRGATVEAILTATLVGTGLAVIVGLIATAPNYAFRVSIADVRPMLGAGLVYVPFVIAIWIIQNVDLFILSRFAPDQEVGVYRLANRIGSVVSYIVSAFLIAWVPVSQTPLFDAARRERGVAGLGNLLVFYFALACMYMLLGLTVGANALAQIFPASYGKAAPLIPVVGTGFLAYGFFVVLYRAASFPDRRRKYFTLACVCSILFVGLCLLLVPPFGGYGAAEAVIGAFAVASVGMLVLSERGPSPLLLRWRALALGAALAAACFGLDVLVEGGSSRAELLLDLAALLLYPVLLVLLGVVPRDHVRALRGIVASTLRPSARGRRQLARRLSELPAGDRDLALRMVDDRRGASGMPGEGSADTVRVLRRLADAGPPTEQDDEIAAYLMNRGAIADRRDHWQRLRRTGVNPLELHELARTLADLERLPRRVWREAGGPRS
jgi:O-antigen/teichoic acid export membrane protein